MDFKFSCLPDPLSLSLEYLEQSARERAQKQAEERQWPSVVYEDMLDAEEVEERIVIQPNTLIFGGLT